MWLVTGQFDNFYTASAGASAALLGLMVVAISVVNTDDANLRTRELRTVLAGSSFIVLVDVFIVSMVALVGGAVSVGSISIVLALVGLTATVRLVSRAWRAGNFSETTATRYLNMTFAGSSLLGYSGQLGLAIALVVDSTNAGLQRAFVYLVIAFYISALARAWQVSGITRRS